MNHNFDNGFSILINSLKYFNFKLLFNESLSKLTSAADIPQYPAKLRSIFFIIFVSYF